MHANAHREEGGGEGAGSGREGRWGWGVGGGGYANTIKASPVEIDSGRKIPCRAGDSNTRKYCAWLFCGTIIPAPRQGRND